MFQCKDVTEEASNYLDGALPLGKRIGLFIHLVLCNCCRNYLQQIRINIKTISTLRPREDDKTDHQALAEKLRTLSQHKP